MSARVHIRLLCLLLCFALVLPVLASGETTKVAAYLLRLREKPSSTSKVIDAYPRGTTVTILQKGSEWTKVRVRTKIGYMKTNMLAYSRTAASAESTKSSAGSTVKKGVKILNGATMYVAKGVSLNLREEPNSSSDIIATFRGGTAVSVLRRGKYWSYVQVKGLNGYMANEYLVSVKGQYMAE